MAEVELQPKHRRAILKGEHPHIPLSIGQAQALVPGQITIKPMQVWITVIGARRNRKREWHLDYRVRDDRPRFMRRNPHGMDVRDVKSRMDAYGTPRRVSEQDAAEAEEASHYTASIQQAVAQEHEEVVPVAYQNLLSMQGRGRTAEREQAERAEELARRQARQINESIREVLVQRSRLGLSPDSEGMADLYRAMERVRAENEQTEAA